MAGNTNSFGYWGSGGVSPDEREIVWTTATDGRTTIHVANPNTLPNPDIDTRSANYVLGDDVVVEPVDVIPTQSLDSHEEAVYLAHSVHKRGRP